MFEVLYDVEIFKRVNAYAKHCIIKTYQVKAPCLFSTGFIASSLLWCATMKPSSFMGSNIICLFFCICLSFWRPSLLFVGWHVVTLVICSPLLTGLEVLVPTVWGQIQIPIHPIEKGTHKTPSLSLHFVVLTDRFYFLQMCVHYIVIFEDLVNQTFLSFTMIYRCCYSSLLN